MYIHNTSVILKELTVLYKTFDIRLNKSFEKINFTLSYFFVCTDILIVTQLNVSWIVSVSIVGWQET